MNKRAKGAGRKPEYSEFKGTKGKWDIFSESTQEVDCEIENSEL